MEDVAQGKFSCSSCGRSYRWKPELAGRKVKCKCGNVMTAPAQLPAPEDDLDALYALAEEEKASARSQQVEVGLACPGCQAPLAPGVVLCTACGFNLKTGKRMVAPRAAPVAAVAGGGRGPTSPMLGYAATLKERGPDDVGENMFVEYYLPIILIFFGLGGALAELMYFHVWSLGFAEAMAFVGARTIIDMVLLAIASLIAIQLMEVSFGAPGPAVLKMCAIALAPTAVASVVSYLLKDPIGIVGWSLALGMYFALFHYFFDMDSSEVMIMAVIVWLVRTWIGFFIVTAIFASAIGGAFAGGAMVGMSDFAKSEDARAAEMLQQPRMMEAEQWLTGSAARIFGTLAHEECREIVRDLYEMGARDVSVETGDSITENVIVTLPSNKEQRKKLFEFYNLLAQKHGLMPEEDQGRKYLWMVFPEGLRF